MNEEVSFTTEWDVVAAILEKKRIMCTATPTRNSHPKSIARCKGTLNLTQKHILIMNPYLRLTAILFLVLPLAQQIVLGRYTGV